MNADSRQQFLMKNGFGNIINRSGAKSANLIVNTRQGGHKYDRNVSGVGMLLDVAADIKAVNIGHNDIKQDEIRMDAFDTFQRNFSACGDSCSEAGFFQAVIDDFQR